MTETEHTTDLAPGQRRELDMHLERVLRYLADLPADETGVVAAAVVDDDKVVYAGSGVPGPGKTAHAERNALSEYHDQYGEPSEDAWVVTTLSPCVYPMRGRAGCSCAALLLGDDSNIPAIPRFHTGYMDPSQVTVGQYRQLGLDVSLTASQTLHACCENLAQFFQTGDWDTDLNAFVDDALAPLDKAGEVDDE